MQGIYTALITPFTQKNEIDLVAFRGILKAQASAGITGVVVFGSTGESATLSIEEKKNLILTAKEELKGTGVRVIAGTGTNDTAKTIELSKWADENGVDGLLLISPYYNKPTQAGLEAHFLAVANAVQCEIMLYNHPGRTGVTIEPSTLTRLAAHPRIRTLKDSSANPLLISEMTEALSLKNLKMDLLSGDDGLFLPYLSVGVTGIVSVLSNLIPSEIIQIYRLAKENKFKEAIEIHKKLYPLFRDTFIETNPTGIKWAMEYAGYCHADLRLPLVKASPKQTEPLETTLRNLSIPRRQYHA